MIPASSAAPARGALGFPYTVDPGSIRSGDFLVLPGANNCLYMRVHEAGLITKIGLGVGVQSGNISLAVYRNSGKGRTSVPGTRLITTGAIACPAAGYDEVSLGGSVAVRAGDWFALSADNATATFRLLLATGADNNLGLGRQFRQTTAHPAPSPVGTLIATIGYTYCLVGVA